MNKLVQQYGGNESSNGYISSDDAGLFGSSSSFLKQVVHGRNSDELVMDNSTAGGSDFNLYMMKEGSTSMQCTLAGK
jgi:hypothetical protein